MSDRQQRLARIASKEAARAEARLDALYAEYLTAGHEVWFNFPMSKRLVHLPDSSVYVRSSDAAYSHAAVVSIDRARAIDDAVRLVASHAAVADDPSFAAPARRALADLAALRALDHPRAFRVVSLHFDARSAAAAALRAARKASAVDLVLPVVPA